MTDTVDPARTTELAADIVAAFVSNNSVSASDLPALIATVHGAVAQLGNAKAEPTPEPASPAVPLKKSVTPDYIVCLEDGKTFKSLKRHLRTDHDLTPDEYRARWGLPKEYPMVAPAYAAARSELARSMGLGQRRKQPSGQEAAGPSAAETKRKASRGTKTPKES